MEKLSSTSTRIIKLQEKDLYTLLLRAQREGRGDSKREVMKILDKARLEPKNKVTITYLENEIRSKV